MPPSLFPLSFSDRQRRSARKPDLFLCLCETLEDLQSVSGKHTAQKRIELFSAFVHRVLKSGSDKSRKTLLLSTLLNLLIPRANTSLRAAGISSPVMASLWHTLLTQSQYLGGPERSAALTRTLQTIRSWPRDSAAASVYRIKHKREGEIQIHVGDVPRLVLRACPFTDPPGSKAGNPQCDLTITDVRALIDRLRTDWSMSHRLQVLHDFATHGSRVEKHPWYARTHSCLLFRKH
jgi:hypothetical protein